MNKLLPILLAVVLSSCTAGKHAIMDEDIKSVSEIKERYFSDPKQLDPIEGIWNEGEVMIVIIKNKENRYQGEDYLGFIYNSPNSYLDGKVFVKIKKSSNPNVFVGSKFWSFSMLPPYDMEYELSNFVIEQEGYMKWGSSLQWTMIKTYPLEPTSVVNNDNSDISGTGFFINSNGTLLTNHHVIENCQNVKIIKDSKTIDSKVIGKDEKLDLAVIKADTNDNSFISIDKNPPTKLQDIIAAGYPFGKYLNDDLKYTSGIVSSIKGPQDDTALIQIDAALNYGNSGGPIIDKKSGALVGVAVSGIRTDKIEGVNFAVKNSSVINFLQTNQIKYSISKNQNIDRKDLSEKLESSTVYVTCN